MMIIQNETKYWLVRPGVDAKCFNDFYRDKCIALGWDRIDNLYGDQLSISFDSVKDMVWQEYGEFLEENRKIKSINRKIGDIASKVYRFVYELKENDIIITPGDREVLIGKVVGKVRIVKGLYNTSQETKEEQLIGELNKVRDVVWLKRIDREKLEPNIRLELRVVHGISQISNEQVITEINRTLFDSYEYNNVGHSIFRIRNEEAIDFEKYADFISCIRDIYSIVKTEDDEYLSIKTNIQSPGPIELIGSSILLGQISMLARHILKREDISSCNNYNNHPKIEELKQKYKNHDYEDYDFPCGGTF